MFSHLQWPWCSWPAAGTFPNISAGGERTQGRKIHRIENSCMGIESKKPLEPSQMGLGQWEATSGCLIWPAQPGDTRDSNSVQERRACTPASHSLLKRPPQLQLPAQDEIYSPTQPGLEGARGSQISLHFISCFLMWLAGLSGGHTKQSQDCSSIPFGAWQKELL